MLVLIIDDNFTNVQFLQRLAQKMPGVETLGFVAPLEALDWCKQQAPDLVVVDYMMPGIDGLEFIRRFRAMDGYHDIPLVMVTAADEKGVRQKALQLGTTDFLAKPVDANELMARMANLLSLRRHQLALQDQAAWLAGEVRRATSEIVTREEELILRLSRAAEYRDRETGGHLMRMANYSELIAARIGLDRETRQSLLRAAPMHDVGKVGIPDHILLKPGRLDEAEFAVMMEHARIGYGILRDSTSALIEMAATIALSHHERFDGTGYPDRVKGHAIPLVGRICAVADVFDALTSERPYKKAWPVEQARMQLETCRSSHFDPVCVDAFLGAWDDVLAIRARFGDGALAHGAFIAADA